METLANRNASAGSEGEHPLLQKRPGFLDLLDRDPERAKNELWTYVATFFKATPPKYYRCLSEEEREECVREVYISLVDRDFRRLRKYRETAAGFGAWLNRVSSNWIVDYLRKKNREPDPLPVPEEEEGPIPEIVDTRARQDDVLEHRRALEVVAKALATLGDLCKFLILAASEGRPPREMVVMLGRPPEDNVAIAEKHRYCLKKLRDLATREGVDLSRYLRGRGTA